MSVCHFSAGRRRCAKTFVFSLSMSGFHNVSHDGNYDRLKFCIFLEMHQLRTTGSFSQV
jgi:hypothetical protein